MLIASYNQAGMGDNLVIMTNPSSRSDKIETKHNITKITNADGALVGINLLEASTVLDLTGQTGQVSLTAAQVAKINTAIQTAGFAEQLESDETPKLVVGYVESVSPHPDSDHLQITTTRVSTDETVQIVSGSPNMQADILVVVAKVGAMMPSGLVIWPGALRGVASNGMITSGRELNLPNAPQVPGALILPADFAPIGTPFDPTTPAAQALFA
ncbi:MAG: DUF4479 and tRNA-binding domain-containing protein [Lactobacillaceae bacterium]|jgi:tRNA-binding protein|nr:DUF4479 and tRNA-binding domain-containing protein [Lactobacillaceae bacterium]